MYLRPEMGAIVKFYADLVDEEIPPALNKFVDHDSVPKSGLPASGLPTSAQQNEIPIVPEGNLPDSDNENNNENDSTATKEVTP